MPWRRRIRSGVAVAVALLIALPALAVLVDEYWVGGSGSWTDTAHWSLSSGGAGGAAVPDGNTDVHLDASSGSGTLTLSSGTMTVHSLDANGSAMTFDPGTAGEMRVDGTVGGSAFTPYAQPVWDLRLLPTGLGAGQVTHFGHDVTVLHAFTVDDNTRLGLAGPSSLTIAGSLVCTGTGGNGIIICGGHDDCDGTGGFGRLQIASQPSCVHTDVLNTHCTGAVPCLDSLGTDLGGNVDWDFSGTPVGTYTPTPTPTQTPTVTPTPFGCCEVHGFCVEGDGTPTPTPPGNTVQCTVDGDCAAGQTCTMDAFGGVTCFDNYIDVPLPITSKANCQQIIDENIPGGGIANFFNGAVLGCLTPGDPSTSCATPAPTATITATNVPSVTPTITPSRSPTRTPTITPPGPSVTRTPTGTPTPTCLPGASMCNVTCASPPCDGTPIPSNNALFGKQKTTVCTTDGTVTVQTMCRVGSASPYAATPVPVGTPITCNGYTGFTTTYQDCMCRITAASGGSHTTCFVLPVAEAVDKVVQ